MAIEDRHTGPEYHSATPLKALNSSFSHMLEARDRSEKHIIMQQALKLAHDQVALIKRGIRLQFTSADTQPGALNHLEQAGDLKPAIIQLLTLVANAEQETNRSAIEASVIEHMNIVCLLVLKETKKPEPSEKNIELTIKAIASAQLFLISRDIHLQCTSPQQKAEPSIKQEKKHPTVTQVQDPSRRKFLFGAAAAGSGLALLAIEKKLGWLSRGQQASPKAEAPLHPTPTTETTPEVKEDKIEELKRLVGETKYYRNQIGLPNLPEDFQQNTDELSWQKAQHERSQSYTHNVDSGNVIFTRYLEAFCEQCFGENEHDVCVGSYTDPQEPGKTAYDCGKHMLLIPDNMRDAYPLDECAKYYLHEVAGHGTDPEIVVNQFQPDVYIRILHGKARMLTKIFDLQIFFSITKMIQL